MACASLGAASDFNVFLFGSYIQSNFTVQGRVAAGGFVTFQDHSVSTALPVSTTRADLIIGGNVNIVRGFNNGNTVISPTSAVTTYTMINSNGVSGQPFTDTPVDFNAARNDLQCLSAGWGALPPNGTADDFFGTLQLNGSDPALNIISVSGAALEAASLVALNIPDSSTVLINVQGENAGFGNYVMQINGISVPPESAGGKILWNFPQTTVLRNGNGIISGTILAPFAAMSANGSTQLNGQLIAGSYDGTNGGLRPFLIPFIGCLPEITACGGRALSVTKTVNGSSSFTGTPGTSLTYLITVTNTGSQPVHNIAITDDVLGVQQIVPLLESGDVFPFVIESEVSSGLTGTQYTNTAVVESEDVPTVTASATVTIAALPVIVQFTKTANQSAAMPGDQVNYQFSLLNLGNTELTNVRLVDPMLGLDLLLPSFLEGTLSQESFIIPPSTAPGSTLANTARLYADNLPEPGFVESTARISITSPPATASFRKLANVSHADPGTTIQYFFIVQNTSAGPLQTLVVNDPALNFTQTIDNLNIDAIIVLNEPYTIPGNAPAGTQIDNTATLTGAFGTLTASESVTVNEMLSLVISKEENSDIVNPGEEIIYAIRIFNAGNASLNSVAITDNLTGFQTLIPELAAGQALSFTTSFLVPSDTPSGTIVTNAATAQSANLGPVRSEVSAVVTTIPMPPNPPIPPDPPITPAIILTGAVSQASARPGETVTFIGTITNISAVRVRNLFLRSPFFHSAGILELLEPGSTFQLSSDFTVPAFIPPSTVFTATLTAFTASIPLQETSASFSVLAEENFVLTKTVNKTEVIQGETVIYTVRGINTGNVPIHNIRFIDRALKQDITIGHAAPGTMITEFFNETVTAEPGTVFLNEARAISASMSMRTASASYTVFGLQLNKQASSPMVMIGGTVSFSVTIRNPMSIQATDIVFRDLIPVPAELVPGSVTLNGIPVPDPYLFSGISLPELPPNGLAVLAFSLLIVSEPDNGFIQNQAEAAFRFSASSRSLVGKTMSNIVTVTVEDNEE